MFDFYNNFFFGANAGKHPNALKEAKIKKNWAGLNIFYNLLDIVMNLLKLNLAEGMDERFAKLCLINSNMFVISKIKNGKHDETGELMNLNVCDMNNMTPYGLPLNMGLIDYTGKSYGRFIPYTATNKAIANCVMVRWSLLHVPPIYRIMWYANRLIDLQASISAAISNLKATVVVKCEKEQLATVKKAWTDAGDGLPVIFTYNGTSDFGNQPELLCNNVTGDILKQLMETYDKTLADFCSEFGINSNAILNKLSGVSDKELSQNEQKNEIVLNGIVNQIKDDLADANKMFGTNMSVELNFDNGYNGIDELLEKVNIRKEKIDGVQEDI